MKNILIALGLAACLSTAAFATEQYSGKGLTAGSVSASGSESTSNNAGNVQNISFVQQATEQKDLTRSINEVVYSGTQDIRNVPAVVAPALTSSNDTCMGSSSLGAAGVGFGVSIGTSWTDKNCVMLKNARELYNMGMKGAAMARLCMDDDNKEALELTGFVCPQTAKANKKQAESVAVVAN